MINLLIIGTWLFAALIALCLIVFVRRNRITDDAEHLGAGVESDQHTDGMIKKGEGP